MTFSARLPYATCRLAIAAGMLIVWELAPQQGIADRRLLPPPSVVFVTLGRLFGDPTFIEGLVATVTETAASFLIAVPLGFVIGILIAENRFAAEMLKPMVFFVFSIPKSIFLPLFILAFWIGFFQKVAFGVFSTIFIVMMTAFAAIESVRHDHLSVARSSGASRAQIVFRVYLPSMTPVLLEAIRLAMIFNFTGILRAEMYASRVGLGNLMVAGPRLRIQGES